MGRAIRNLLQTALPINFHLNIISMRLMYFCLSKVTSRSRVLRLLCRLTRRQQALDLPH